MMYDDADETIERIAAALRPLPDVDPAQRARVLVAVAAERERDRSRRVRRARTIRRLGAGSALVAAGLIGALWMRGSVTAPSADALASDATARARAGNPVAPAAGRVDAQLTTRDLDGVALQPVQLVFRAPTARHVTVVGDFNGWNASATSMRRDPASGMWSQTLALRPGRHVYAFVVDDSVWMRDPRTPAAPDADFGRPGSVLLVGQP